MAKKKLNKKVAILGIIILGVLVMGAALVYFRHYRKDPEKLITKAEAQWEQIETQLEQYRKAVTAAGGPNEQTKAMLQAGQDAYIEMLTTYRQAAGSARNDDLKISILFTLGDYYLENNAFHAPDWDKALRAWHTVTTTDPANVKARMNLLQYFYDAGDSGSRGAWARVKEEAEKIATRPAAEPDPFVTKALARANLEMARSGEATNQTETVDKAIADFEALLKASPDDVNTYQYLADAIMLRGRLRKSIGQADAVRQAFEQARTILQQAIEATPDDVRAHANLLRLKLDNAQGDRAALEALGAEYEALIAKFPAAGEAFAAQCGYYQHLDDLDKAVKAIARAVTLDKKNVDYAATAANLYYLKASSGKDKALLNTAIDIARNALTLEDAQDIPGPRQQTRIENRVRLHSFLAKVYVGEALEATQAGDSDGHRMWVDKASQSVHVLTQIFGTETNVYSNMWTGILGMARGDGAPAVARMIDAYQQLKAANRSDPTLAYMLARAFEGSPEIGSRMQFLGEAIGGGAASAKPELLLDYADLLMGVRGWANVNMLAKTYEDMMGPSQRSATLRVRANISAGQFDGAVEILAGMDNRKAETRSLELLLLDARILRAMQVQSQQPLTAERQQQLDKDFARRADLVETLLAEDASQVPFQTVVNVCSQHLGEDNANKARELIAAFTAGNKEHNNARVYQCQLMEPDPVNISAERRDQIALEVLAQIAEPADRHLALGQYYLSRGQYSEATAAYAEAFQAQPDDRRVIDGYFEILLAEQPNDLNPARSVAEKARANNLDQCQGAFYLARLAYAGKNYQDAMNRIEECLKARPIFSHAYYLRSLINAALDNHDQSVQDALTASQMNPVDPVIARQKAAVLLARNTRLGAAVTGEQREQTEDAMREAIVLNPNDGSVRSAYAEYRSERHPEEAIAQRQYLIRQFPNFTNHLLLGNMAMKMGLKEADEQKKAGLMEIARSAYEKAFALEPDNAMIQQQYAEYLRKTDQHDKIEELFRDDPSVLWRYYLRDGRYEQASALLKDLYAKNAKDASVVLGLAMAAQQTGDKDNVKKYAEELLAIENTVDNQLQQIQMYLDVGLIKEAGLKLEGFRERNPREPRGMLLESLVLMNEGQFDKAMDMVNRNLEIDTGNAQAWRLRGRINRLKGNHAQAVDDLQKSKSLSGDAMISMELAQAYRQTNRMSAAIGELKSALNNASAPVRLLTFLEQLYMDSGQKAELRKFYTETIAKNPKNEFWYYRAAQFYLQDQDTAKAEELLTQGWEITRTKETPSAILFDLYLETLWRRAKYDKLLGIASQYTDSSLGSIAYAQMGQTQAKLGNRDLAVQHYHRALEKCGGDNSLIAGTLRNMTAVVGIEAAEKWTTQKLAAAPESLIGNLVMFHLASNKGDYNTGLKHLDRAIAAVSPGSPVYSDCMTLKAVTFVQGYIKTRDKQYLSQGIAQYERLLADQPQNINALNNLAYLLADNDEQLDKAREYAARAHAAVPDNANIMDTYAYVLCKTRDFGKAEELLLKAIQIYELEGRSAPAEVYKHLGMAQEGLQRKTAAGESYRRALDLGGQSLTAQEKTVLNEAVQRVSQ